MTYGQLSNLVIQEMKPIYGDREARAIQRYLFVNLGGKSMHEWILLYNEKADENFCNKILGSMEDLKNHKPVQYVTGKVRFCDLNFEVSADVLIPRPETEELVFLIINKLGKNASHKILDIGTGSGVIAVSLAKYLPFSTIDAIDISQEAIEIAKKNARLNEVTLDFKQFDILRFKHQDSKNPEVIEKEDSAAFGMYDVIVSNPPYVKESEMSAMTSNVLDYEPHTALFVPDDDALKFYIAIINFSKTHLTSYGWLFFEINEQEDLNLKALLEMEGFENVEVLRDFNEKSRFIVANNKVKK